MWARMVPCNGRALLRLIHSFWRVSPAPGPGQAIGAVKRTRFSWFGTRACATFTRTRCNRHRADWARSMKRRHFLGGSLAVAATAGLSYTRYAGAATASDLPAVSRTGAALVLRGADVADLRARLRGPVLLRTSEGYDAARRVWNGA